MSPHTRPDPDAPAPDRPPGLGRPPSSLGRLFLIAAAATAAALSILLLPTLWSSAWTHMQLVLPYWLTWSLETWSLFLKAGALAALLAWRPRRLGRLPIPDQAWAGADRAAAWACRSAPFGLTAMIVVLLAGWLPHYLTWPWWTDTEYFAVTAQAWASGILPYRDLYDFNFPGPTYVHWLLGQAFGWGRTVPFQALDAALLVGLGVALAAWSRARFGATVPGLVGYCAVLLYYLMLDYALVGQRDWHAPMFVAFGILALEARRGGGALAASALLFALALSFRPHPVVLLPALLSALDENLRPDGGPWAPAAKAVVRWSALVGLGLAAAAAPVVIAGVADDFLHWFRLAWFGGRYGSHQAASRSLAGEVLAQLGDWRTSLVLGLLVAMAAADRPHRRLARTWALALAGVLLYKPLSPVAHGYLLHPGMLVRSIGLAALTGWAWTSPGLAPAVRAVALATVLLSLGPWLPAQWHPRASLTATADLASGREPSEPPPGCSRTLAARSGALYTWDDYRGVLDYLRRRTGPGTRVGGFFRDHPFPTVNAPTGRLPLFPSPAGVLWLRFAAPGLEGPFVEALGRPGDAVVVWTPGLRGEPRMTLPRVEEAVRRWYRPEARFGPIEVWRREPGPGGPPGESTNTEGESS